MTIQARVLKYLVFKDITPYRFCKDLKLSLGYLDKKGAIGTDKYLKIIEYYPEINPEWLLAGKGEMLKDKKVSSELLIEDKESLETRDVNYKELWKNSQYTVSLQKEKIAKLEKEVKVLKYAKNEGVVFKALAEPIVTPIKKEPK